MVHQQARECLGSQRDVWPQGGGVWLLRSAPLVAVPYFLQVNCPLAFLPNPSASLTESANYSKDAGELGAVRLLDSGR